MAGYCLLAAIVASLLTLIAFIDTISEDRGEDIKVRLLAGATIWLLAYLVFAGLFVTLGWMVHLIK